MYTSTDESEKQIQNEIRVALSNAGCLVLRNNSGIATYSNGAKVRYGVGGTGGADLLGITGGGIFFAVEVKTNTGRVTPDQENFLRVVRAHGGKAGVARSVNDALEIVK